MTEPGPRADGAAGARRFLTFRVEERLYALPAEEVSEVIRPPAVARLPLGPKSLLGMANLRGSALPVASLRALLGRDEAAAGAASRAIVLDGDAPVALAVDGVDALVTIDAGQVESRGAALAAHPGEQLRGVFRTAEREVVKVLEIRALLADAFTHRAQRPRGPSGALAAARDSRSEVERDRLVCFEVGGQEFALALDVVREIIPTPERLAAAPQSDSAVLGVCGYREGLLPVLSLRGLLGLGDAGGTGVRGKVLVTEVGGALVGLLADRTRAVLAVDPGLIEPPPAMLAARMGGEAKVKAIYRGEGGRRLICVLDPDQLFREDVMRNLIDARVADRLAPDAAPAAEIAIGDEALFLVFRLGDEEFGLPVGAVDEVARLPDRITRVPKTPRFLEGVINLRGEVLPIVDQRRRFGMPRLAHADKRRLVVARSASRRAGLIVDSVSEVLRVSPDAVEEAPHLTGEAVRLVSGVINLPKTDRMILLLDPAELLSHAERGLLDRFEAASQGADL
jgi:purine-binding chemotaxis protein CheW